MINIKELSIGNYLRIAREGLCIKKGTIIKINGIDAENKFMEKGLVGTISCHPLDKYQFDGGIWLAYLEPIEITPEILEKNGFRYNDMPSIQGWEQFGLTLYHGGNGYLINCGQNVAMKINAVHQLQNALTLCGIYCLEILI